MISASGASLSVSRESTMIGRLSMLDCREVQEVLYDSFIFVGWGGQAYRFGVDL